MPQRYVDISEQDLHKLRDGLDLLERLDPDKVRELDGYLYAITKDPGVLDAAREAIAAAYEEEIDESDVEVGEIALAIPLSGDILYYLTGSGLKLRKEWFAYAGTGGEGIRSESLGFSHYKPQVTVHNFTHMALGDSDAWLDQFLKQYGTGAKATIKKNVQRTEEATEPGTPTPAATLPPPAPTPKQTSIPGGRRLDDLLEDFLG